MLKKVYVISYKNNYLGYTNKIFAFETKRYVDYVRKHLKYEANYFSELDTNLYLMKTHYNTLNELEKNKILNQPELNIKQPKLYDLVVNTGINNISVNFVDVINDQEDGDLVFLVRPLKKKMPLDQDTIKYNLEVMFRDH